MELYIKQEAFTGHFTVMDALGKDRWYARRGGGLFAQWDELQVFDTGGNLAAQLDSDYYREYSIKINGQDREPPKPPRRTKMPLHDFVAQARQDADPPLTLVAKRYNFKPTSYYLEGLPWRIDRNKNEYTLHADGSGMMRITKEFFVFLGSYRLDIAKPRKELLCVCIALAIACIEAEERARD